MNVNQEFRRRTRVVSVSILLSACVATLGWSGWGAASEAPSGRAARRFLALSARFRPDVERDDAARELPVCNVL